FTFFISLFSLLLFFGPSAVPVKSHNRQIFSLSNPGNGNLPHTTFGRVKSFLLVSSFSFLELLVVRVFFEVFPLFFVLLFSYCCTSSFLYSVSVLMTGNNQLRTKNTVPYALLGFFSSGCVCVHGFSFYY